jgi:putative two-component system response regulator
MSQPQILIVDDNAENLSVLGELLHGPYRVRAANSGERALALARQQPRPDLILLDVMMPGMSGHEVLTRLREHDATRDVPVIFVTALNALEDEEHGLALGAVDYITKPLRPAIVLARVRAHLELKQARDRLRAHNQTLEAEVARRMRESLQAQDVCIRALARLAETRDNETGNHLLRTQASVRRLAELARASSPYAGELDDDSIALIAKSAPLHDIGKVGIPDSVLLKPGKLDAEEWVVMKTHAMLGAHAIERAIRDEREHVRFLDYARQIAAHHHERWDGAGYPDGLKGTDIPLAARLMAVADVFDALISRRVYKPPMPFDQARRIVCDSAGTHLDPVLVELFDRHFGDFCEIAQRHADEAQPDPALAETAVAG